MGCLAVVRSVNPFSPISPTMDPLAVGSGRFRHHTVSGLFHGLPTFLSDCAGRETGVKPLLGMRLSAIPRKHSPNPSIAGQTEEN